MSPLRTFDQEHPVPRFSITEAYRFEISMDAVFKEFTPHFAVKVSKFSYISIFTLDIMT